MRSGGSSREWLWSTHKESLITNIIVNVRTLIRHAANSTAIGSFQSVQ